MVVSLCVCTRFMHCTACKMLVETSNCYNALLILSKKVRPVQEFKQKVALPVQVHLLPHERIACSGARPYLCTGRNSLHSFLTLWREQSIPKPDNGRATNDARKALQSFREEWDEIHEAHDKRGDE